MFKKICYISFLLLVITHKINGQVDKLFPADSLYKLSIFELRNIQVNIATKESEKKHEAPSTITVISAQDISENQCRDMVDVFNLIPGFTVQTDLFEIQSFSVRGLYGFEGRVLVQVNGMTMNDLLFGTYPIGNDFPLRVIEKIEVIRGPGSVYYGGFAELAIVNIITKQASNKLEADIGINYGVQANKNTGLGHQEAYFNTATKNENYTFSLFGSFGESAKSNTSDRIDLLNTQYTNFPQYELDKSTIGNSNKILGLTGSLKNKLYLNAIYKDYRNNLGYINDPTGGIWPEIKLREELFRSINSDLYTKWKFKNVKGKTGFAFHHDLSWVYYKPEILYSEAIGINRYTFYTQANYTKKHLVIPDDKFTAIVGTELFEDFAFNYYDTDDKGNDLNGVKKPSDSAYTKKTNIWNSAFYGHVNYGIKNFNFNAAVRFDNNQITGSQWSPRFGIIYNRKKIYSKLLFSNAFRAPNIATVATNYSGANSTTYDLNITREKTKILELIVGYSFTKHFSGTINLYTQYIADIIEFNPNYNYLSVNAINTDGSEARHGSEGFETVFEIFTKKYRSSLSNTFISAGNRLFDPKNENLDGLTYNSPKAYYFNGVPRLKTHFANKFNLNNKTTINLDFLFYSKRYQYRYDDTFTAYAHEVKEQLITNLGVSIKNIVKNVDFNFSIQDIFNSQLKYISAFDSYWNTSMPFSSINARGRELTIRLNYNLNSNQK